MNILSTAPLRAGAPGDVARRLAFWVGPAIRAADDTLGAALYLALGHTIAATRAFTARSLSEVFGHLAIDELAHWERSVGMLSGEGAAVGLRQTAVRARWIAIHAGPSLPAIIRALRVLAPEVIVLEILAVDVHASDPLGVYRLAVLLNEAHEADAQLRARIEATLAPQAQAQVSWAIGRGDGPDIDAFLCDRTDSECDLDLLAS